MQKSHGIGSESTFSISQNKGALVDFLFNASNIEKGENVNQLYATAASNLETSGMLAGSTPEVQSILTSLKNEHNVTVVA